MRENLPGLGVCSPSYRAGGPVAATATTRPRLARRQANRQALGMDLTYPPEAETFRKEIRAWLEANLPDGWFDDGFELKGEAKARFHDEWTEKLFEGGWICASWPTEYGGKGLSTMDAVVLAEEF